MYIEIFKGMYGLPYTVLLASIKLRRHLVPHGYFPTRYTPGLWKYESKPLAFILTVDDYFTKYANKANADHLLKALKEQYTIAEDWAARLYCGVALSEITRIVVAHYPCRSM